ncbi:MAG: glycoside hydrolase family 3 N-terminal domain-containing protein [Acidobacteriota bacterium]
MRTKLSLLLVLYLTVNVLAQAPPQARAQHQPEGSAQSVPAYKNPRLPIPDRVADLLSRMTLEEKIDQLVPQRPKGLIDPTGTFKSADLPKLMQMENDMRNPLSPEKVAILRNAIQRYQVEKTRLGIPEIFFGEALHGSMQHGATMFPMPIGLASTWDPRLMVKVYTIAGDEASATGIRQVFAPDLDLGRDPRWGRTEESFGEDPFLVRAMGLAEIRGLQGPSYDIGPHHVLATAKHFTAHGAPEGGTNTAPVNVAERTLRENFLLPFQAAVEQGDVGSIMASYNEINGVPDHINRWLLTDVLRREWGFRGEIVSDGSGLQMLVNRHHSAANYADAARLALHAGIEYDLSNGAVFRTLLQQVKDGRVSEAAINKAAADVLTAKFRLGLFDHPYVDVKAAANALNTPASQHVALQAAREAMVLLKNQGGMLPLDVNKYKTIAVIGPDAAQVHLGGYSRQPFHEVSVLEGIRNLVGTRAKVVYSEGCKITTAVNAKTPGWLAWYNNGIPLPDPAQQKKEIAAATEVARQSDAVILVIGENESIDREAWSMQHLGDRDDLNLFGDQGKLVRAMVGTGKPVVVLLINGRPITINYIEKHVPAVVEAWYPGQEGGTAAAEVLFGQYNPGGKLPITFPRTVGDLPDFYNHKPSAIIPWIGTDRSPLFPFGYGLSYTTFKFSNLRLENPYAKPSAAEAKPKPLTISGKYEGTSHSKSGHSQAVSLDLTNKGGMLTGEISSPAGMVNSAQPARLQNGQFNMTFDIYGPYVMKLNGTLNAGVLKGTYTMSGPGNAVLDSGTVEAKKSPGPALTVGKENKVIVKVDVANTGTRAGDEVAELYIHERVSEVTQPVEELRKFQRVSLKPGQTRTVTFTLTPQDFAQWDINMHFKVEPGIYDVMVGGSSNKTISVPLELVQR